MLLSSYQYDIKFKNTVAHTNADGLSRLNSTEELAIEASVFNISQIDFLPVTAMQIRQATSTDPTLSKILNYTKNGWPKDVPENLKLFQSIT